MKYAANRPQKHWRPYSARSAVTLAQSDPFLCAFSFLAGILSCMAMNEMFRRWNISSSRKAFPDCRFRYFAM